MAILSKNDIAASTLLLDAKKIVRSLLDVNKPAAAGSTQAGATALTAGRNAVTAADGTKAVRLPQSSSGQTVWVINTVADQDLKVYPEVGGTINALSANSAFTVVAGTDATFMCETAGQWYVRGAASVVSGLTASGAELNVLHSVTAGTVAASSGVVVNSVKAVDTLRATTDLTVGGTGVPGAATTYTAQTKAVTAFTDTTAKAVWTVTIPNAAHAATIEFDFLGVLGAGGAIGAGEATKVSKYQVVLARTAGVNVVAGISSAIGGASSVVAGGDAITSVVATLSSVTGAVGASNTFTVNVAITRSGAGATAHTLVTAARILNGNVTGVTIA